MSFFLYETHTFIQYTLKFTVKCLFNLTSFFILSFYSNSNSNSIIHSPFIMYRVNYLFYSFVFICSLRQYRSFHFYIYKYMKRQRECTIQKSCLNKVKFSFFFSFLLFHVHSNPTLKENGWLRWILFYFFHFIFSVLFSV